MAFSSGATLVLPAGLYGFEWETMKPIALAYIVPGFAQDAHALRVGSVGEALVLTEQGNPNSDVLLLNIGEAVPRVYMPYGDSSDGATPADAERWKGRFAAAVKRSVEHIETARARAVNGELTAGDVWNDPHLASLASSLAEACEMGGLLIEYGNRNKFATKPIWDFISSPIRIEATGAAAVECASLIR